MTKRSAKFVIAVALSATWVLACLWLAQPWISDLSAVLSWPVAYLAVFGIALIPAYLAVFLAASVLMAKDQPPSAPRRWPSVTVLIAAYNEERCLTQTVQSVISNGYQGRLELIIADDGSEDGTMAIARRFAANDQRIVVVTGAHGGKARALNRGLRRATGALVVTVDADTRLAPESLSVLVSRHLESSPKTAATAGAVLADPDQCKSLIEKMQYWDYQLGIAAIKRCQGLYGAVLVAQGAFSVYCRGRLQRAGGWPDMIGEDIVLTWTLISEGQEISFEPRAVAYTSTPGSLRRFARQRRRWARGMIEGLRYFGVDLIRERRLVSHGVGINFLFPLVDVSYSALFLPGLLLAATGNFLLVGPWTLLVLPVTMLMFLAIGFRQRALCQSLEIPFSIPGGLLGFLVFCLAYQAIMAPVAVAGYLQELANRQKRW